MAQHTGQDGIPQYLKPLVSAITQHCFNKYESNVYSLWSHDIYEVQGFQSTE